MRLAIWANSRMDKLDWIDMKLIKIAVVGATLMVVKLWPPIASLDWYWYGIIFIAGASLPAYKAFIK